MYIARSFAFVLALAFAGSLGCGDPEPTEPTDAGCPNDLPASCPASAPKAWSDVEAIFMDRCAPCHSTGGAVPTKPLVTYDDVFKRRSPALNQLYACKMPPEGAAQPTSSERAALLAWFACGAPSGAP